MRSLCLELLPKAKYKSLIWRQLAIIYQELDEPSSEVTEAFEKSMALADQEEVKVRFVNCARPYATYLLRNGNLSEAFRISSRMIEYLPLEAELHITRGDIFRSSGDLPSARSAYELAHRLAFGRIKALAAERLAEVEVLREVALFPVPVFSGESGSSYVTTSADTEQP